MKWNKVSYFLVILLFTCSISNSSSANKLPTSYFDNESDGYICKASNLDFKFLLDTLHNHNITDTILLACCYHQLGVHYFKERKYIKSIKYNRLAANLRTKVNDGLLWKSYRNIGICYRLLNIHKKAVQNLEASLDHYKKRLPKYEITILKNLAKSLTELGEYERAIDMLYTQLNDSIKIVPIARSLNTLAKALYLTENEKNIQEAMQHLNRSIKISKSLKDKKTELDSYSEYVVIYEILENYSEIIKYAELCLDIEDFEYLSLARINIAWALTKQNKYRASIEKLEEALKIYKEHYLSENNYYYAHPYENLADNYFELRELDTALLFYQKSLINLTNNFRTENIFRNPNPSDTTLFIYSNPDIIRVLDLKATAANQYFLQNNNTQYLNLAQQTYQTLINFHNKLQQDISTENSRLLQAKNILEYLERALEIAYTKQSLQGFDSQASFRLMEKNKATVLSQLMNENDALLFSNLPDSLKKEEQDLKIAISFYERQFNEAKAVLSISEERNQEKENEITELENSLYKSKEKYHRLIKTLEENYPDYYLFKYQQKETTLAEVQSKLNKETALFEYFVGKKNIYIFSIQYNQSKLYQIEKPKDWDNRINDFVGIFNGSNLSDDLHSSTEVNRFTEQATFFYKILLQQPLNDLDEHITNLQIIPDAELNYIPFDVLFYEKPGTTDNLTFSNLPYLIKQKAIGYAYSASLWFSNLTSEPLQNPIAYGGYASEHSIEEEDADLPVARKQVQSTAELFKGKSYLADTATKSAFLGDNNAYNILHFAMHGKVNDTLPLNSHLVFTKTDSLNKLYAADLYNTKLQTDLAVLGACNTGTGKVQKGEGVMSLSRAFTYAGCPSLVMSLWSIPDVSSAKVLDSFFTNLKDGQSKDVALQHAKLDFLQTSEKSHPLYWAGLVAVGNLEALEFKSAYPPIWLYGLIGCLALFVMLFLAKHFFSKNKMRL